MNLDRSIYTTASNDNNNASSIRPRNRRLISYGDETDLPEDFSTSSSRSQPKSTSPFDSRGISPIPDAHPLRLPPSSSNNALVTSSAGYGSSRKGGGYSNASSSLGLWESWSSIQGIASSLLGSDAQQATKAKNASAISTSLWGMSRKAPGPKPPTPQWGPKTGLGQTFTIGSKEEREAMVQAKKREALLLTDVNTFANPVSSHKRRDSDLRMSSSATSAEQDGDALVYVHKVKPQDTLAGVMIRYQCQPAIFRKVNRLWPNDNIQTREHVFLPVEACAIRGRKIEAQDSTSRQDESALSATEELNHSSSSQVTINADDFSPCLLPTKNPDPDPEYTHEYFVSIPGTAESVLIARVPRRTLGFFPPSRRKSQTFSDTGLYSDSPKTSLDLSSRLQPPSLNASPSRNRTSTTTNRPHRSNSGSYFLDRLKGPGGVGTLRGSGLAGSASRPGPAEDSLNKMFAHHLPNVAPRESFDSVHSSSSTGLENVGGMIEGWVRKAGTRIVGAVEPAEAYRQQLQLQQKGRGRGRVRMGDLIELESNGESFEWDQVGGIEAGEGFGHGHEHDGVSMGGNSAVTAFDGPSSARSSRDLLSSRGNGNGNGNGKGVAADVTATEEALLRERFPPRGRMVDAQTNRNRWT